MILQREIAKISERTGIAKSTIDKDWVLGHFISAVYAEPELGENLIFKGGTCLKKCWFPEYRFSEDLDFTSRSSSFRLTEQHLAFVGAHVLQNAGIKTDVASLRPLLSRNKLMGYEAVIKFWGADHPRNVPPPPPERWQSKIKIEIILHEAILFDQRHRQVLHPYSDELTLQGSLVPCYAIEEVLAEKLRALIQRSYTAPRDYYDIWYLSQNIPDLPWPAIVEAFHQKMAFKGLEFVGDEQLLNARNDKALRAAWKNSLGHQIKQDQLPSYEKIRKQLKRLFFEIFS